MKWSLFTTDMVVTSLIYHCKYINKFALLLQQSAVRL